ncbi:MAG: ParB/RepB/Spo0J family partition protein, partial [Micrococcales bacterium]|nr:ParB/RepB/Spo0J family partition protein [Micrococcales bacterium]
PGIAKRSMGKATHLLIAGHRRLAAAKKSKLDTVPVLVREDLTTRAAQVEAMLVENLQRTDLTPVEEADAYQLILDIDGLTQKALAEKVGQPVSRIRDRLKLAKIGDAGRKALQAHQVTIEQAMAIAEFDDDPTVQKRIVKAVGRDNFTYEVNRARAERTRAREMQERLDRLAANGVTVLDAKPKGARELWDLLPGFPQRYQSDKQIDAAEKKDHGKCPGRATYWYDEYGSKRLGHGCTQPKLHPKVKPPKTAAEKKAEAELAQLKEELAAGAGAAAAARAEFIRDRLAQTADPVLVRTRLQTLVIRSLELGARYDSTRFARAELFLEVLGAPVPEHDKGTSEDARTADLVEALNEALQNLSVNALVLALDVAMHVRGEVNLRSTSSPYPNGFTYTDGRSWVETLTELGYGWSDWERARFVGRDYVVEDGTSRYFSWDVAGVVEPAEDADDAAAEAAPQ